jgi:hypothetical protein
MPCTRNLRGRFSQLNAIEMVVSKLKLLVDS